VGLEGWRAGIKDPVGTLPLSSPCIRFEKSRFFKVMTTGSTPPRVVAVLGPTNTGKTHYAIERMAGHASGMIGFPLRLLARENYDRVVKLKGKTAVALVTGEEKIVPPRARYFLCTVESMPLDRPVDFLGVDEIQMAADPERGHVFTDRMLRARGLHETILIGAETIGPLIHRLVPDVEFMSRPRLSKLTYAGQKKLTRLPRRSAVVGFSASQVYELAELLRRRRGGTAVVLGALSPRTRNAQVEMYQAGEVDYLVATDAIGMGLNMDVDHVAFSAVVKFDGRHHRRLAPAELAQIAGRAGRHMNDGSFGTTAALEALDPEVIEAIENHRFPAVESIFWRNPELDFKSPARLLRALERPPRDPALIRARIAEDQRALAELARDPEVIERATSPARVRLLWDVCQIPDFRKIMAESHARLIKRLYMFLSDGEEKLPADWVAKQIARADRTEGDIETLTGRIADIRTWTYVSHRADWLADAAHWQERARAIEDKLSDALHERLTQRFVDRRSALLVRRLADGAELAGAVTASGEVLVEGQYVGRLNGFRFEPDVTAGREDGKALIAAANRALRVAIERRVAALEAAQDKAFAFNDEGRIVWEGDAVAHLKPAARALAPAVEPLSSDLLEGALRERIGARIGRWLSGLIAQRLALLVTAEAHSPDGPARGLVFQLVEALGALPRRKAADLLASLQPAQRKALAALGIRIGQETIFFPALQQPAAIRLRRLLWAAHSGEKAPRFDPKATAIRAKAETPESFYLACGYRRINGIAVRAERLERLADKARKSARQGAFAATPELRAIVGCEEGEVEAVLRFLGYRPCPAEEGESGAAGGVTGDVTYERARRQAKRPAKTVRARKKKKARPAASPDSPFAGLRDLVRSK
jgi:ATP-dependent RNA helicase SUPV3L1/SUV3